MNEPEAPHTEIDRLQQVRLYAWVGEDEFGSGVIGIKQGLVPAGYIPLVATQIEKVNRGALIAAMSIQADTYGHKIYLCCFTFDRIVFATHTGGPL